MIKSVVLLTTVAIVMLNVHLYRPLLQLVGSRNHEKFKQLSGEYSQEKADSVNILQI